mmetsp:Transcript_8710/g.13014  ORF Transcript_8710/g.13014 Transcript_8710/m.13014 type:complete len:438 (+) Transcript_8710:155-1468(+)|eukprot:CAMPEP_0203678496 /NCGR_PEP_ID=MMETSP0090-20130426/32207_1 /ASSEMBLY_ACC=CAM_ASM_001088 /TAXON_ID=426623 /ORGANISM="Chaetoceros affinis, Strain CCMP159" /LENGTH=437 /DNA_ID=CAMNT_0050545769 /DNA_START=139 /DNA_END=1452 /DNA_ORIENTATION=+
MCEEENHDWTILADELVSSFIIHQKNEGINNGGTATNTIEQKASQLIECIKQADVPKELISPLMSALSYYSKRTLNTSNSNDDTDFLYVCIHEYLSSRLIDENSKIEMIQFINLVVSSGSIEGGDDERSEEKNGENAKLVLYNILICSDDHRELRSPNFHALENSKLQQFWDGMHISLISKRNGNDSIGANSDTEAIIAAGDYAAEKIYSGAKYISNSLTRMVPKVTNGIENLGEYAKQNITPNSSGEDLCNKGRGSEDQEDQGVAITQALVENSDKFRVASQSVTIGIRDIGTRGINNAVGKWEENSIGKDLCPQDEIRESIVTAGKIGLAAIGATVEIAESVFEVTKAVAQSSVKATANVAQHKYGGNTKTVIENTGTATGNILRGITHVTSLEGQVLSKTVMKNTARVNIEEMVKTKSKDTEDIEDDEMKKKID